MKVKITKSNTSFVRPGEITDIETRPHGSQFMWSESCQRYEKLSWVTNMWGVEYEELPEMHDE